MSSHRMASPQRLESLMCGSLHSNWPRAFTPSLPTTRRDCRAATSKLEDTSRHVDHGVYTGKTARGAATTCNPSPARCAWLGSTSFLPLSPFNPLRTRHCILRLSRLTKPTLPSTKHHEDEDTSNHRSYRSWTAMRQRPGPRSDFAGYGSDSDFLCSERCTDKAL
ncbi:hypothetical protein M8818_001934 [Zalaria obscura]|uniref:Uncharacterized protein n=1 Tax=Zalaria obscura TaxID=2024903 RepID=A0ACC3SJ25_9PEZI